MVLFLYQDIFKLICKIIQLIVKPDLLRECESAGDVKKIDILDKNTFLKCKYINVCLFCCKGTINKLEKNDVLMLEKNPIGSVVSLYAFVFNPIYNTKGETVVLQNKMKMPLAYMLKLKVFTTSACAGVVDEYSQLIKDVLINASKILRLRQVKNLCLWFFLQSR